MPEPGFVFVPWKPAGWRSEGVAQQIRSHCMKGKNVRADSKRLLRKAKEAALQGVEQHTDEDGRARLLRETQLANETTVITNTGSDLSLFRLPVLIKVDSEMSRLAANAKKTPRQLLQELISVNNVHKAVYVTHQVTHFSPGYPALSGGLNDLLVQGVLFGNSAYRDISRNRPYSEQTLKHLIVLLKHLGQSIANNEAHQQDSMIHIIIDLAFATGTSGDFGAFQWHMDALARILRLRGLNNIPPLILFILARLDLTWVFEFGQAPKFEINLPLQEPQGLLVVSSQPVTASNLPFLARVSPAMREVFDSLQAMVIKANECLQSGTRIGISTFQHTICFVQTRLFELQPKLTGIYDQCLLLGMFAFILTLIKIPGRGTDHNVLINRLKGTIDRMNEHEVPSAQSLKIWSMIMLVMSSTVSTTDVWMGSRWAREVNGKSWNFTRKILKGVLWLDVIHDKPGKQIFTDLGKQQNKNYRRISQPHMKGALRSSQGD